MGQERESLIEVDMGGKTRRKENGACRFMDMGGKGHRDAGSKRERER